MVITEKLAGKGLKTLQVYIQRSMNGVFIRCDVRIQPILGKFIEETDFQFQNCKVIPIYGCQWDFTTLSYQGGSLSPKIQLFTPSH